MASSYELEDDESPVAYVTSIQFRRRGGPLARGEGVFIKKAFTVKDAEKFDNADEIPVIEMRKTSVALYSRKNRFYLPFGKNGSRLAPLQDVADVLANCADKGQDADQAVRKIWGSGADEFASCISSSAAANCTMPVVSGWRPRAVLLGRIYYDMGDLTFTVSALFNAHRVNVDEVIPWQRKPISMLQVGVLVTAMPNSYRLQQAGLNAAKVRLHEDGGADSMMAFVVWKETTINDSVWDRMEAFERASMFALMEGCLNPTPGWVVFRPHPEGEVDPVIPPSCVGEWSNPELFVTDLLGSNTTLCKAALFEEGDENVLSVNPGIYSKKYEDRRVAIDSISFSRCKKWPGLVLAIGWDFAYLFPVSEFQALRKNGEERLAKLLYPKGALVWTGKVQSRLWNDESIPILEALWHQIVLLPLVRRYAFKDSISFWDKAVLKLLIGEWPSNVFVPRIYALR